MADTFDDWAAEHNMRPSTAAWCPYTCVPRHRCSRGKGKIKTILYQQAECICELPPMRDVRIGQRTWIVEAGRSKWHILTATPNPTTQQIDALYDVVKTLGMEVRPLDHIPGVPGKLLVICTWDLPPKRMNL